MSAPWCVRSSRHFVCGIESAVPYHTLTGDPPHESGQCGHGCLRPAGPRLRSLLRGQRTPHASVSAALAGSWREDIGQLIDRSLPLAEDEEDELPLLLLLDARAARRRARSDAGFRSAPHARHLPRFANFTLLVNSLRAVLSSRGLVVYVGGESHVGGEFCVVD